MTTTPNPLVSVVIPCYNQGQYIDDALRSVEAIQTSVPYEIIIVNDGSPDPFTNERLAQLAAEGYHVINQANGGASAARNTGIRSARGTYILPLDGDNKIREAFFTKALPILEGNANIDAVYGDRELFGAQSGRLVVGPYNLQKLMLASYIDTCAIYRKTLWEKIGGYDEKLPAGVEDWEFFMHSGFKGATVHYIPEILFDYRVVPGSAIHILRANRKKEIGSIAYLTEKHAAHFGPQHVDDNILRKFKSSPFGFIAKLVLMAWFPNRFKKLVAADRLRKHL